MERKTFTLAEVECKDAGEGVGEFTGYLSVYGNTDSQGEVVDKGAFKRSLAHQSESGEPLPLMWNHDRDAPPIGTLALTEDAHGLKVKGKFLLATSRAAEVYEGMKAGVIRGLSIGFRTVKDKWDKGVRHLQEVELFEGSATVWPANKLARVTAVKSDGTAMLPEDALAVVKRAVIASKAEGDGSFAIVQQVADALRQALLATVPEGSANPALWDALSEVRNTVESIMQMLWAFGEPADVAEGMAFTLTGVESKAKEQRVLEGASLRKVRAALATLKVLLDGEDSTGKGGDADSQGHSAQAVPPALIEALEELKRANHESRRTHNA